MDKKLERILERIYEESEKQQEKINELYKLKKETDKDSKEYNKVAADYYYNNGMNNELIIVRNIILEELYREDNLK